MDDVMSGWIVVMLVLNHVLSSYFAFFVKKNELCIIADIGF